MTNVLEAFKNILFIAHTNEQATNSLFNYLTAIVDDINEHISNQYDRNEVRNMLRAITRTSEEQGNKLLARFENQQQ